jgi:hypothetical protein
MGIRRFRYEVVVGVCHAVAKANLKAISQRPVEALGISPALWNSRNERLVSIRSSHESEAKCPIADAGRFILRESFCCGGGF